MTSKRQKARPFISIKLECFTKGPKSVKKDKINRFFTSMLFSQFFLMNLIDELHFAFIPFVKIYQLNNRTSTTTTIKLFFTLAFVKDIETCGSPFA